MRERADADQAPKQGEPALARAEITEIGDFAPGLLEAIVERVETASGHQNRDLARLAIPICLWTARQGGEIIRVELARVIREIIDAIDDQLRRDQEQSNPMRPWRIINLNYGIVASRSHDPC